MAPKIYVCASEKTKVKTLSTHACISDGIYSSIYMSPWLGRNSNTCNASVCSLTLKNGRTYV